ncbi:type II toxin-antitoxin system VapC family toxin [Anabaena cylindrica FACHB-243]|uniref:PilT protein domain protein n=1 Tax=Anabaena cylindrica (strain ATCC 27899 / PCC 7122) TaxID=272123 RepID=K9ZBT3_ANACC|nr:MULTISPECIES: type II toxin-antitoxin system VapC family toxin [Anabaena]AFZ56072.1 PilT protein domain protein [Anabaena cylindrica PCC 7122]MBD2419662.1 type II toxin-antitoxin system VapC family toxin [Anabaena cylindrica FACHB-243]MBY5281699.1 type II toxin-antitoxin system VapC family toxin [Anabaena sp. CCAP 1446/1C]MBY5306285.1 type II toxin-antitoxin system VapC family toxin [Anabaena sp. CCAP 1446/1C]MCM2408288.1 type II toxin-antitoxin system VapC family toxin [Anabaena sp. CCAP 1
MKAVLDASALLAYLQDEPGGEAVEAVLAESVISSVNWAEVVQKAIAAGVLVDGMRDDLDALGMKIEPFTPEDGLLTGQLWQQTRQYGLSLGDRACLSVGLRLGIPVLTTDRIWANLGLTLDVRVIR